MATQLDVYRDWLGIQETARPLTYYQLLRLKKFEDDPAKVRAHYSKMNAHVRKFAAGEFSRQSQDLLNELARAMLCLTDRKRKSDYDGELGRTETGGGRRRTLDQLLVEREVATEDELGKARRFADAVGLELCDAVVQQKLASQEVASQLYAESEGLPFVELGDVGVDQDLAPRLSAVTARQHSCVPLLVTDGVLLMASPKPLRPDVEDDLRLRFEMPVRTVICTASAINAAVNEHYPKSAAAAELASGAEAAPAKKSAPRDDDDEGEPAAASADDDSDEGNNALIFTVGAYLVAMFSLMFTLPKGYGFLAAPLAAAVAGIVWAVAKAMGK